MTDLLGRLRSIVGCPKSGAGSPFASLKTAEHWLGALPAETDYETHHALVEGLERFNAENETATLERMKILMHVERAGLPMQARIVEQYLSNQAAFRLARQALWRESWAFWSLLAEAWLGMLKQARRNPASAELRPYLTEMATRALRYTGLAMRWDYHQARSPAASAWRRVHKLYRLVELEGEVTQTVAVGACTTHCAREYVLVLLLGMVHPLGYRAREIEAIVQIIEGCEPLPRPAVAPEPGIHTHAVDLSLSQGASVLDGASIHGGRLRYLALGQMIDRLKSVDPAGPGGLARQVASLIERGGIRRGLRRTHRFGRVSVAAGMANILNALAQAEPSQERPSVETWALRDESPGGMGFVRAGAEPLPHGRLVAASGHPAEGVWQLLAIRWARPEDGQHLVGAQLLSRHPRRVEIHGEAAEAGRETCRAILLPLAQEDEGASHLLLPDACFRPGAILLMRDGGTLCRLRLGEVQERHEGWLRVGMDVLGRELVAVAA